MKTNTLLLLSLLFLTSAYGQKIDVQVGGNYYFKGNHQIIKDQKGNLKSIYTNYNVYKNTNVLNNTQTIDKLQLEREAVTDEIIKIPWGFYFEMQENTEKLLAFLKTYCNTLSLGIIIWHY
ncbi:MAG: hypothetical protein ACPG7X_00865 [Flavobacteriaceae bacterium]